MIYCISQRREFTHLSSQHNISGSLDSINEGLPAPVQIVKLGLGHRVVHVNGGNLQLAVLEHLVEVVDPGGGLLGQSLDVGQILGVFLVDQVGEVTSVIEDHVEGLAVREEDGLLETPHVLLVSLPLPGIDWDSTGGHGSCSVILHGTVRIDLKEKSPSLMAHLGGEDVAGAPCDVGSELDQSLDEDRGLDGHVETAGNPGALQRFLWSVHSPEVHQSRHLILGHCELLATPVSQGDVS